MPSSCPRWTNSSSRNMSLRVFSCWARVVWLKGTPFSASTWAMKSLRSTGWPLTSAMSSGGITLLVVWAVNRPNPAMARPSTAPQAIMISERVGFTWARPLPTSGVLSTGTGAALSGSLW